MMSADEDLGISDSSDHDCEELINLIEANHPDLQITVSIPGIAPGPAAPADASRQTQPIGLKDKQPIPSDPPHPCDKENPNENLDSLMLIDFQKAKAAAKRSSLFYYKNKNLREKGLTYTGRTKSGSATDSQLVEKEGKIIKERCEHNASDKSLLQCAAVSETRRNEIFERYWCLSWEAKREFVKNMVQCKDPVRTTASSSSLEPSRTMTCVYTLKDGDGIHRRVCKVLFCSTLAESQTTISKWLAEDVSSSCRESSVVRKRKVPPRKFTDEQETELLKFIEDLPKLPSHYCRQTCDKTFLEKAWKSIRRLYEAYKQNVLNPVSSSTFKRKLKAAKVSIQPPRKDLCNFCSELRARKEDETATTHYKEQKLAIAEKNSFKKALSTMPDVEAIVVDVEAALPVPKLNCNATYFRTKLLIHNMTYYNLKSKAVDNYLFTEVDADSGGNTFTSIVIDHLTMMLEKKPNTVKIVIYSDSCFSQNKNQVLSNTLLHFSRSKNITIEHKYLVQGHTHLEVDNFHSLVERSAKDQDLYDVQDYKETIQEARSLVDPDAYVHVHLRSYDSFRKHHYQYVNSIRPGRKSGDPTVGDVRAYLYQPSGPIMYKLKVQDQFEPLPIAMRTEEYPEPTPLFSGPQRLSSPKKRHLKELLPYIPEEKKAFLESLVN